MKQIDKKIESRLARSWLKYLVRSFIKILINKRRVKMTLEDKQKKIIEYIMSSDRRQKYEEIQWLVEQVVDHDDEVLKCFDYVFMDENDNVVFEED